MLTLASKRENSTQHCVEHYSKGPHVHLLAIVLMFAHKLRSHVGRCAAEDLVPLIAPLGIGGKTCKAKVYYFYHLCFLLYKNIIEFDVSVCYALRM